MLETQIHVVVMNHLNIIPEVPVNFPMTKNNSREFVLKNCEIQVLSKTPEET